jgi:hypothetical protein
MVSAILPLWIKHKNSACSLFDLILIEMWHHILWYELNFLVEELHKLYDATLYGCRRTNSLTNKGTD